MNLNKEINKKSHNNTHNKEEYIMNNKIYPDYLNELFDKIMKFGITTIGIANITGVERKVIEDIRRRRKIDIETHKKIIEEL